jgi:hypothetical protein
MQQHNSLSPFSILPSLRGTSGRLDSGCANRRVPKNLRSCNPLDPPGVLSVASPRLDDWSNVLGIVCSAASRLLLIKSAETGPSRTTWQVISSFGVLKSLEKLRTIQDPLVSLQF